MSSAASAADAIARLNDSRALSADAPAVTLAGSATTFRFRAVIRGLASALYFLLPRQAERWTQLAVQYEVVAEKRSKCGGAIDAIRTLHRPGSSQLRRSRWRHHRKCVLAKQTQQPQIQYSVEPNSERPIAVMDETISLVHPLPYSLSAAICFALRPAEHLTHTETSFMRSRAFSPRESAMRPSYSSLRKRKRRHAIPCCCFGSCLAQAAVVMSALR